jgi:hypothetical protein
MRLISLLFTVTLLVHAGDRGVPPRASPTDYQANAGIKDATLAAAIVPSRQIEKMFSADIARQYIVLEVAVYPQNSGTFDLDWFDFGLKIGDTVAYVERPRDVATPWAEKNRVPEKPVTVVNEAGVVYSRTNDPVNGHRSGLGTYEGVAVTNDPRAAAPPPGQGPDPQMVEQHVSATMLPEGPAQTPVAGYLFFPRYKLKRKSGVEMDLQWSRNGAAAIIRLRDK